MAILLMFYLSAINPSVRELLRENHCIWRVGPLIQLPSTRIKLLSKALIARLIPTDVIDYNKAALVVMEDGEADHLISMLTSVQSYQVIPIFPVMIDLCRSPHNVWALVSRDVLVKLLGVCNNISKEDLSKSPQLIWRMVELKYNGTEGLTAVINNGTLAGMLYSPKRLNSTSQHLYS